MTPFWQGLGWCLIWLGIGGCINLAFHDKEKPIIRIENSFNRHP